MIPISNAAGTVKLIEQVRKLCRAPVDEIVLGSYTVDARAGNQGHTYEPPLNALGLPNPGSGYLSEFESELQLMLPDIVVSIAGFTLQEFGALAALYGWAYALELNLSCPNVWEDIPLDKAGRWRQHRIGGFDPRYVDDVLEEVGQIREYQIRVKLPPYSDAVLLEEVADICVKHNVIVVASNTFPNGWLPGWGTEGPRYGGVSGLREIALGQVRQFREHGVERVIGVGGVRTGADILDFEDAGAGMVQVGLRYMQGGENPDVFTTLIQDAQWS